MSEYNDIDILNMSLKYIFSNYLLDYNNIKNIFNKSNLVHHSIFSYVSSFNNIKYINTLKNLVNYLLSKWLVNHNNLPISMILNTNKIFLEKSPEYTDEEKIEMLLNNKVIIFNNDNSNKDNYSNKK